MPVKSLGPWLAAVLAAVAGLLSACSPTEAGESSAGAVGQGQRVDSLAALLRAENIIDQPGAVAPALCDADDDDALPGASFATCEELTINFRGMTYRAYLFSRGSRQLTVYHEGHNASGKEGLADSLMPDARALLIELLDFSDVLYFDMPMLGVNSQQKMIAKGREISTTTHDRFALLDAPGNSSLTYFLNPIDLALDSVAARYTTIKMIGRSGGGWTTTLYAALDTRIVESVSVAGTAPIAARGIDSDGRDDLGDWEQYGATIYRWLDYQDLYALAASGGRRHEQLYFEFDNCCFSGTKGSEAREIYETAYGTGTSVSFTIVAGATDHYAMPTHMLADLMRD
jgi:pimeloyl-ACP methyl ester carboxylesterase